MAKQKSKKGKLAKPTANLEQESELALPSAAWTKLVNQYPGCPWLEDAATALYALPDGLLEALKQECPGLLSADDEQFEQDLTRLSRGIGFFVGQAIIYPPLRLANPPADQEIIAEEKKFRAQNARLARKSVAYLRRWCATLDARTCNLNEPNKNTRRFSNGWTTGGGAMRAGSFQTQSFSGRSRSFARNGNRRLSSKGACLRSRSH